MTDQQLQDLTVIANEAGFSVKYSGDRIVLIDSNGRRRGELESDDATHDPPLVNVPDAEVRDLLRTAAQKHYDVPF